MIDALRPYAKSIVAALVGLVTVAAAKYFGTLDGETLAMISAGVAAVVAAVFAAPNRTVLPPVQ